jgi:hypothetical protein
VRTCMEHLAVRSVEGGWPGGGRTTVAEGVLDRQTWLLLHASSRARKGSGRENIDGARIIGRFARGSTSGGHRCSSPEED